MTVAALGTLGYCEYIRHQQTPRDIRYFTTNRKIDYVRYETFTHVNRMAVKHLASILSSASFVYEKRSVTPVADDVSDKSKRRQTYQTQIYLVNFVLFSLISFY